MGIIQKPFTLTKQKIEDKLTGLITSHTHAGSGSDELLKVSANDTTAGYLSDKINDDLGIIKSILNAGGNEQLNIKLGHHYLSLASTGLYTGATLSVGATTGTFDIAAGEGLYVDSTTGFPNVSVQPVNISGRTNVAVTNIATQPVTYISVDKDDNIIQSSTFPSLEDKRNNIFIGVVVHSNNVDVQFVNNLPDVALDISAQVHDVMQGLGFFNLDGNIISANGANLSLNKSAGSVFKQGANYENNKKDPHTLELPAKVLTSFRYRNQNGVEGGNVTVLDPTLYDNAGTDTALSANKKAQIQRVYIFPSNEIRIQRGQQEYNTLADAVEDIGKDPFITETNIKENGLLLASIAMIKNCTDLTNPSEARIFTASRFGELGSVGSSAVGTLQQAYDNAAEPEIVLNSTQGSLNIADNATPLGTDLVAVQSNDGLTKYFSVDATGTKLPANGTPTVNYVPVCTNADGSWAWGSPPKGLVDGTGLSAMQSANITGATDGIASGAYSIAIGGRNATAFEYATAVGSQSYAGNYTASFGYDARTGDYCVAVGYNSNASYYAIGIGPNTSAGANCISIGYNSITNTTAIGIGPNSNSQGTFAVAVGYQTTAVIDSCSYGGYASAGYRWACSIGKSSTTGGIYATTLGSFANAAGEYTIAIGGYAKAGSSTDSNTIAIGYNANALNYANSILLGANTSATADNQIKIGDSSHTAYIDGVLNVGSDFIQTNQRTITNSTDAGVAGTICHDSNYIYVCTATNTWKRVALSTW